MYIGVDLGTTACKAVRFDETGAVQAQYHREYSLITRDGFVEQSAEEWWQLVAEGLRAVASPTVRGISISTQGVSIVPVDRAGKPLSNAISWLDARAGEEARQLANTVGTEAIWEKTGKFCTGAYPLPKLMWLKRNRTELYRAAYKFLMPLDYLNMRLTGRAVCDYTMAGGTMAWNLADKAYDRDLLDAAGVDEALLPEVACMGTPVGPILPEAAEVTGLPAGCPVYLGGQDQKLAALGAGIDGESVTVSLGTASAVTRLVTQLPADSLFSGFRFDDDHCSLEGVLDTSGAALKWLMGILGQRDYQHMNTLAEEAGGSGGVVFDTDLTAGGCIRNLKLGTTPGNLVYALFEGVSRAIAGHIDAMGGCSRVLAFGGGAKSDIWCRILADVTGREVGVLSTPETGCLGAAMLAAQGKLSSAKIAKTYRPK